MNRNREPYGHLFLVLGILIALTLLISSAFIGKKAWSHKAELTRNFEACMERAPFKIVLNNPKPKKILSVEELQDHFDKFDRIYKETGLPPIWNGETLVP